MEKDTFDIEIKEGRRYQFGKNWLNYQKLIKNITIQEAKEHIQEITKLDNLESKTFLDVGCGSGLFSLAAIQLGAKVISFDFDKNSVKCTEKLKIKHKIQDSQWKVFEGSILDESIIDKVGQSDIVYSWGVLHHTGNLELAMKNIKNLVNEKGFLCLAIYNHQQFMSKYWTFIKRNYNKYFLLRPLLFIVHFAYPTLPSLLLKKLQKRKYTRGMNWFYDLSDWLGGYPFEVRKPEEVIHFYLKEKFHLEYLETCEGKHGLNGFSFKKFS